jgi:hypothetical protein
MLQGKLRCSLPKYNVDGPGKDYKYNIWTQKEPLEEDNVTGQPKMEKYRTGQYARRA